MNDDAALVELARSGDSAAFGELYERYFDRVYDFLARMVKDQSEAADLTQDTFLKAMNSLQTLSKGASFKSWLFTIARNSALNRLERASRTEPLEGTDAAGEEQSYDVIDTDRFGNPEEAAEASSLAAVVWEAAAAVDPKYRSVLLLNLREGLDSAEIAGVLGVTKNHAYVMVNRMKAALASAVGALALFRNGRRECAELDAVLSRLQIAELSPEARRLIERHAGSCEKCQEQRRKLASPFAIFAGFAFVQPMPGVKESIFGSLQEAFAMLAPGESAGAGNGYGGGTSGELHGLPSRRTWGGGGSAGNGPPGGGGLSTLPASGGGFWSKRRLAMLGAAAAIVLTIAGPVAAVSLIGSNEGSAENQNGDTTELAVVEATSTPAATQITSLVTAPASRTPPPSATTKPTEVPPSATPGTPVASGAGQGPELSGGGQGDGAPSNSAGGPGEPGFSAPPTATPDASGPPPGGSGLQQPPPPTATPTAIPCLYSMEVAPAQLVFSGGTHTMRFFVEGEGCGGPLQVIVQPSDSWVSVSPTQAGVSAGETLQMTVTVDLANRNSDSAIVEVASPAGLLSVQLTIIDPTPTPMPRRTPTPTLTPLPGRGGGSPGGPCSAATCPSPTPTRGPGGLRTP